MYLAVSVRRAITFATIWVSIFLAATTLLTQTGAPVPELAALDAVMQYSLSRYQSSGGRGTDVTISLRDLSGEHPMQDLHSGPGQINTILPEASVLGDATISVRRDGWPETTAALTVTPIFPGVFTVNAAGLAAASLVRSRSGQLQQWESVLDVDAKGVVAARPIAFGSEDEFLYLILYCTGVRGRGSPSGVYVQIGDYTIPAAYAGPQQQYPGLDQVNIALPRTLSGAGAVIVKLVVDGVASNTSTLLFRN